MLERLKNVFGVFWEFVEAIVAALVVFVVIYFFFFQPNQVKGHSMDPTFYNRELILTDKVSYRFTRPKRGDIIVFQSTTNPDYDLIKRIIAIPAEKIKISAGKVFINDLPLDESAYLDPSVYTGPESYLTENQTVLVPEGKYFVMGDNRQGSSDSRNFGPISTKEIIGNVFLRYWPLNRLGKIDNPLDH